MSRCKFLRGTGPGGVFLHCWKRFSHSSSEKHHSFVNLSLLGGSWPLGIPHVVHAPERCTPLHSPAVIATRRDYSMRDCDLRSAAVVSPIFCALLSSGGCFSVAAVAVVTVFLRQKTSSISVYDGRECPRCLTGVMALIRCKRCRSKLLSVLSVFFFSGRRRVTSKSRSLVV